MTGDLKAAIIGCGPRAEAHVVGFRETEGADCATCADLDRVRADAFAEEHGLTPYYEAMEMLEVEAPEIISVATPEGPRADLTRMCAEKRLPGLIVETPMAPTIREARTMVEICRANDTVLSVCHQIIFAPEFELLKRCADSGDLGEVRTLRAQLSGRLAEQGAQVLEMLLWLCEGRRIIRAMGQVVRTAGAHEYDPSPPSPTLGHLVFDDGTPAVIEADGGPAWDVSACSPPPRIRLQVIGTEGMAEAVAGKSFRSITGAGAHRNTVGTAPGAWERSTGRLIADMVGAVKDGRPLRADPLRSLAGLEAIHAIYRSALERDGVRLPLSDDATPLDERLTALGIAPGRA